MAMIIYMLTSIQSEWKVQLKSSNKTKQYQNTIDRVIFYFLIPMRFFFQSYTWDFISYMNVC